MTASRPIKELWEDGFPERSLRLWERSNLCWAAHRDISLLHAAFQFGGTRSFVTSELLRERSRVRFYQDGDWNTSARSCKSTAGNCDKTSRSWHRVAAQPRDRKELNCLKSKLNWLPDLLSASPVKAYESCTENLAARGRRQRRAARARSQELQTGSLPHWPEEKKRGVGMALSLCGILLAAENLNTAGSGSHKKVGHICPASIAFLPRARREQRSE